MGRVGMGEGMEMNEGLGVDECVKEGLRVGIARALGLGVEAREALAEATAGKALGERENVVGKTLREALGERENVRSREGEIGIVSGEGAREGESVSLLATTRKIISRFVEGGRIGQSGVIGNELCTGSGTFEGVLDGVCVVDIEIVFEGISLRDID
eukprot:gb/GEZN01020619.1/.p2 GENE.gb/GEZN01020619.1/~~gb/GEZN01020619.1/.p2  ORF type:complete len:157 (+),score=12.74 gb/GEZN01020619.1/:142-612(+)